MAINFLNTVAVDENVLFVDTVNDRVGIGTDSPSAKLDVVGSGLAEQFKLSNTTADATTKYGALVGRHYTNSEEPVAGMLITSNSSATGQTVSIGGGISAANAVNSVVFYTAANNTTLTGTERMRIGSTGNVGIGTTSPAEKLVVNGSINSEYQSANFTTGNKRFFADGFGGGNLARMGAISGSSTDAMELAIYTSASGSLGGTEKIRVDSTGNVGIGTTTPNAKLHVGESALVTGYTPDRATLAISDTTNGGQLIIRGQSPRIWLDGTAGGNGEIYLDNTNLTFQSGDPTSSGSSTMYLKSDGNVGIGTTSPETTLSVVGATSTNDLIGGSINLATSSGWVIPSGAMSTRVGYYGGDFTLNGAIAENGMEWGLGPFNDRQLLWTTTGSTDSNGDGGWNKTLTNLDIESPYLSVVYFKRVSSNTSGNLYHGTGNNILNLDGTSNTNPYFTSGALSGFDQDVWYASVGVIQSNSDSNTTAYTDISGLYRLDTGVKVANANTFKFASTGATLTRGHRTYLFYSTDVDVVAQFANPGFYKIDGDQPKLHDILGDYNDDVFWSANGDDIYNDNSGNVGIGTTTPDTKLDVEAATNPTIRITNSTSALGAADVGSLEFFTKDASTDASRVISSIVCVNDGDSASVPDGQLVFKTALGGASKEVATERMRIDSAGNVGIGTTTPAYTLQVGDGTEDSVIAAYYSDGEYTKMHGYGLYMSRIASYIRPVTTTTQTLYIGAPSQIWNAISHDANTCSFSTGGTEHMRVTSSGNVGIGTTSPDKLLDVSSDNTPTIRITNTLQSSSNYTIGAFEFFSEDASTPGGARVLSSILCVNNAGSSVPNGELAFYTALGAGSGAAPTEKMRIDSSGNVGIGTTSPESNLEISDSTQATGATLSITNAHNGSWVTGDKIGSIDFRIDDPSTTQPVRAKIHAEGKTTGTYPSSSQLVFSTANVNTLYERMLIDSAGNVGIGTTSPSTKLEIEGDATGDDTAQLIIASGGADNNSIIHFTDDAGGQVNAIGALEGSILTLASQNELVFKTGTSSILGNTDTRMIITSIGNVGMGTTSPSTPLDVNGEINASGDGYYINGTAWAVQYSNVLTLGDWDGNDFPTRIMDNNSNEILRVADGGVGIGTTSPGSKLDIIGATTTGTSSLLRVRTTDFPNAPEKIVGFYVNTSTERGFISVNQYQTAYSTSSDYRLKENIVPIPNSIERLKELKPCRFNFIQGDPNHIVDGFIAHEAAEVIPEAVTGEKDAVDENNNPSYQGIDQSKVVPLLTAALQEAISKIEQLETRIQTLENN